MTTIPKSLTPRSSIDLSLHPFVDGLLKELKLCSRRLQAALSTQQLEFQILDRLFYKGNNQHRTAVFWRHVSEVRRYGRRLIGLDIYNKVAGLRLSFWGPSSEVRHKSMKGAWTHVPDAKSVRIASDGLSAYLALLDKTHECLSRMYHHLHLNMQTGAFLQLMLTLTAITSRLSLLISELRQSVEGLWDACAQFLHTIDPSEARRLRSYSKLKNGVSTKAELVLNHHSACGQTKESDKLKGDLNVPPESDMSRFEETGEIVSRTSLPNTPSQIVLDNMENRSSENLNLLVRGSELASVSNSIVRTTVDRGSVASSGTEPTSNSKRKRSKSASVPKQARKIEKKKKKKKDEIDDIFGF